MSAASAIPIILLAAGQSARMRGADKLAEEIEGEPLLRVMARRARAATDGPVLVALPPAPHPRYAMLDGLDVTPVPVDRADEGMNASLSTAMAILPEDAPAVMILLADLPDLQENHIRITLQAVAKYPDNLIWRGTTAGGNPGHPVVFARALFPELRTLTGDSGAQSVVKAHKDRVALIPLPGDAALNDLDTPEDWARWRAAQTQKTER